MEIHTVEKYKKTKFRSSVKAAEYFRSIYLDKRENNNENQKEELLEKMYSSLSITKKYVVNNLIYDLLSDGKRDKLAGQYFKELLKYEETTYSQLASCIAGYITVSRKCSKISRLEGVGRRDVKSKLERLQNSNSTDRNDEIIKMTAGYFNISPEALITGKGIKYSVNWERIEQTANKERKDLTLFLADLLVTDMLTNTRKKDRNNFIKYIAHSQKTLAEIFSKRYVINIDNILTKESCWIELDKYPFSEYYHLLGKKEKDIIKHTIENLSIIKIG